MDYRYVTIFMPTENIWRQQAVVLRTPDVGLTWQARKETVINLTEVSAENAIALITEASRGLVESTLTNQMEYPHGDYYGESEPEIITRITGWQSATPEQIALTKGQKRHKFI